jgi:hypothetical protein
MDMITANRYFRSVIELDCSQPYDRITDQMHLEK